MGKSKEGLIPEEARPKAADYGFDLNSTLSAVVSLRAEIPNDAFTAQVLGTERAGNGVVISDNGLVLTIGYLITEAETIWLAANNGEVAQAHVVGYDQATGFGLVQALSRLNVKPVPFGSIKDVHAGSSVIIAGHGGLEQAITAEIIAKREFAGYWEYLIDEALFTAPAHPNWGGTACLGLDGRLIGIGSLLIQHAGSESDEDVVADGNMIVPVDLLPPIMDDLLHFGQVQRPPRPWLGTFTAETMGRVIIVGTWKGGPAEDAGLQTGDLIVGVDDKPVEGMAEYFRGMWSLGSAGIDVPLNIYRDGDLMTITVKSRARGEFYKSPNVH